VDLRCEEQRQAHAHEAVMAARRAAYPPLADLADALYWQAHGDDSKMQAYLNQCLIVKSRLAKRDYNT
jgi:hypothetical protein